jgi:hypothetical protein
MPRLGAITLLLFVASCGGGGNSIGQQQQQPPPSYATYNVLVSGTANGILHSAKVIVLVQ